MKTEKNQFKEVTEINSFKRPVLKIKYSFSEKITEMAGIAGLMINAAILRIFLPQLPDRIPVHFNFSGEADSFGGKYSLIALPVFIAVMYILLTTLSFFPHIYNYAVEINENNAETQYKNARRLINLLKVEIVYVFTYIQWKTIQTAQGTAGGLGAGFVFVFLIVMFGTIIFFVRKSVKSK